MLQTLPFDVSRETLERLDAYEVLLRKWTPAINLVSKSTLSELWSRHIVDSAQVFQHLREEDWRWVDLGSGGGLPGVVVAILALDHRKDLEVCLVESDRRKAEFLRTVSRTLGLNADVFAKRIEDCELLNASTISARALASLDTLLSLSVPHLAKNGQLIFLKGASYREELTEALANWTFQSEIYPSLTNPASVVLKLKDIHRV